MQSSMHCIQPAKPIIRSRWRPCLHSVSRYSYLLKPPLQVFLPAEAATALAAPSAAMHMLSIELLVYRRTIDQVPHCTCQAGPAMPFASHRAVSCAARPLVFFLHHLHN
jgi:hypothetical protein